VSSDKFNINIGLREIRLIPVHFARVSLASTVFLGDTAGALS